MSKLRLLFLVFQAVMMIHNSSGYMIRSQGYQIVEGVKNSIHQVVAYRFFLSFDVPLVKQADYLEVSFPVILNKQNTSYPLYRIFPHSLGSEAYSQLGMELSFAADYPSDFHACTAQSNSTLVFFQLYQDISSKVLFILEIIPEPNIEFFVGIYSLNTVAMKVVSNDHLTNRLVYAHSSNIAMLRFNDNLIPGDYIILKHYLFLNEFQLSFPFLLNRFHQMDKNGGYIHIKIDSSDHLSEDIRIAICTIERCVISKNRKVAMITMLNADVYYLQFGGYLILNSDKYLLNSFSLEITLFSKARAFYDGEVYIPDSVLAFKKQVYKQTVYLSVGSMKYHWDLEKDTQNEVAIFVSSPSKHVYNTISIPFYMNFPFIRPETDYQFVLEIDLGQKSNSYMFLKSSCSATFPQIDTDHPILCKRTFSPWTHLNVVQFSNIKSLEYTKKQWVSFRVIVFDGSTEGFRLNQINLLFCKDKDCNVIASTLGSMPPDIPNFINNYDTSKTSTSNSWSSYLGDIQIVSVADTASETPGQLINKAFTSTSLNQGGGIFVNRGVESLVFFLSIDPTKLYSNENKILKMTILADNKFLGIYAMETGGIRLAAQDQETSSYSFSAQSCSQGGDTPGCYDGSTSEVLFSGTKYVMNGKTINSITSTARYTLRCGIPGQALDQPTQNCSKMFQVSYN